MRRLMRLCIVSGGLAALLTLVTSTALAGGWAEVVMVDASDDPPAAGEEAEIRFSLLQHGITAVDGGEVELTAIHPDSGQVISVSATSHGGGRWSASLSFPVDGDWQIGVAHSELATSPPTMIAVGPVDRVAWLPAALALGTFAAVAMVVLGGMLIVRRRSVPVAGAARAGG